LATGITSPETLGAFMEHPEPPKETLIPQVSIPTTLSGSEYTRSFSTTDFTRGLKRSYAHSAVASRIILYDPVVTLETPMSLWLASGVMAIDHAVEVFCSSPEHLVGDTLKLASLQELLTYLPHTLEAPRDLEARLHCQVAAWQVDHSPLRAQPLAPVVVALHSHALTYELGALCRVPYGISACVTLSTCLRWCAMHFPQATLRQAVLARSLGLAPPKGFDNDAAQRLADGLEAFIKRLGLPTRLRDAGIVSQDLQRIARQFTAREAVPAGAGASTETEVLELLQSAW
jgi:alcohol dehydrogenase class IV